MIARAVPPIVKRDIFILLGVWVVYLNLMAALKVSKSSDFINI